MLSRSGLIVVFLCFQALTKVTATLNLEVSLLTYSNPSHQDCDGSHCDGIGNCDNFFELCVITVSSSEALVPAITTADIESDVFTFTQSVRAQLGISDPIVFQNLNTTDLLRLEITITDSDILFNDHIDTINVDIPRTLTIGTRRTASVTGNCGRSTITLNYRVTTTCDTFQYGPSCSTTCRPVNNQYNCNYLGQRICLGQFTGPACEDCQTNYYGPSCDVFCEPSNTHTCSSTGSRVCQTNYFPENVCNVFCQPSPSRYSCNSDGSRSCLGNYAAPLCLECITGYSSPNTGCQTCQLDDCGLETSSSTTTIIGVSAGVSIGVCGPFLLLTTLIACVASNF